MTNYLKNPRKGCNRWTPSPSPGLLGKNQVSGEATDSQIESLSFFHSLKSSCSLTYKLSFSRFYKGATAHYIPLHIKPQLGSIKLLATWRKMESLHHGLLYQMSCRSVLSVWRRTAHGQVQNCRNPTKQLLSASLCGLVSCLTCPPVSLIDPPSTSLHNTGF